MSRRAAAAAKTRRRIVDATLALHEEQGIRATSWEEIADRAGVGVGTVYRHFPSLAELVPACGTVTMERLALPGPKEAAELFRGLRSRRARLRRLIETLFAVYERGAGAIENVRRERGDPGLPMLEEAHARIESALGRLVAEAAGPLHLDANGRRLLRALTDVPVWRSLRAQGIEGADAVDAVTAALEGALRRPA